MRAGFVRAFGFRSSEVSDSQLLRDLGTGRDDSIRRLGSNVVEAGNTALQHGPDAVALLAGNTPTGRAAQGVALAVDIGQVFFRDLSGVAGAGLGQALGNVGLFNSSHANTRFGVVGGYLTEQVLQSAYRPASAPTSCPIPRQC